MKNKKKPTLTDTLTETTLHKLESSTRAPGGYAIIQPYLIPEKNRKANNTDQTDPYGFTELWRQAMLIADSENTQRTATGTWKTPEFMISKDDARPVHDDNMTVTEMSMFPYVNMHASIATNPMLTIDIDSPDVYGTLDKLNSIQGFHESCRPVILVNPMNAHHQVMIPLDAMYYHYAKRDPRHNMNDIPHIRAWDECYYSLAKLLHGDPNFTRCRQRNPLNTFACIRIIPIENVHECSETDGVIVRRYKQKNPGAVKIRYGKHRKVIVQVERDRTADPVIDDIMDPPSDNNVNNDNMMSAIINHDDASMKHDKTMIVSMDYYLNADYDDNHDDDEDYIDPKYLMPMWKSDDTDDDYDDSDYNDSLQNDLIMLRNMSKKQNRNARKQYPPILTRIKPVLIHNVKKTSIDELHEMLESNHMLITLERALSSMNMHDVLTANTGSDKSGNNNPSRNHNTPNPTVHMDSQPKKLIDIIRMVSSAYGRNGIIPEGNRNNAIYMFALQTALNGMKITPNDIKTNLNIQNYDNIRSREITMTIKSAQKNAKHYQPELEFTCITNMQSNASMITRAYNHYLRMNQKQHENNHANNDNEWKQKARDYGRKGGTAGTETQQTQRERNLHTTGIRTRRTRMLNHNDELIEHMLILGEQALTEITSPSLIDDGIEHRKSLKILHDKNESLKQQLHDATLTGRKYDTEMKTLNLIVKQASDYNEHMNITINGFKPVLNDAGLINSCKSLSYEWNDDGERIAHSYRNRMIEKAIIITAAAQNGFTVILANNGFTRLHNGLHYDANAEWQDSITLEPQTINKQNMLTMQSHVSIMQTNEIETNEDDELEITMPIMKTSHAGIAFRKPKQHEQGLYTTGSSIIEFIMIHGFNHNPVRYTDDGIFGLKLHYNTSMLTNTDLNNDENRSDNISLDNMLRSCMQPVLVLSQAGGSSVVLAANDAQGWNGVWVSQGWNAVSYYPPQCISSVNAETHGNVDEFSLPLLE